MLTFFAFSGVRDLIRSRNSMLKVSRSFLSVCEYSYPLVRTHTFACVRLASLAELHFCFGRLGVPFVSNQLFQCLKEYGAMN